MYMSSNNHHIHKNYISCLCTVWTLAYNYVDNVLKTPFQYKLRVQGFITVNLFSDVFSFSAAPYS